MMKKYLPLLNNIFEYVRNRTTVGVCPETITEEVIERFSPEILFLENSNEGVKDIVSVLCKYAYFLYNNEVIDRL